MTENTSENPTPGSPPETAVPWGDRLPVEQAREWEAVRPGTVEWMLTELQREREHRRRMDWVHTGLQAFGSLLGAGTVVAYIWVATYFLAHHAATQGAAILGGGTAALVGGSSASATATGADPGSRGPHGDPRLTSGE
ncbi:hypothetical protein SVIO_011510 [Streptomyces violaceusniger]|uniref:Uncharacterized protein n=1 Tax=Streptomyces violaceusniger TaxID=68280 RepID=A0A4D4KVX9_STRVO|nr:hypothetical protein SVIO_011510 [Streptomyces violaceusniger]